jgi:hypothetical protein
MRKSPCGRLIRQLATLGSLFFLSLVGTGPNALKTQVWTAICAYLLVAIVRKRLNLDMRLYTIMQILSVSLFEKTPILQAFSQQPLQIAEDVDCNQLILFNI